jgi:hypothetical protein
VTERRDIRTNSKAASRKEGPGCKARTVAVTGLISAALLSVMYGVTLHRAEKVAEQHQAETQRDAKAPAEALQRPPA